jgi:hypothetical protein
MPRAAMRTGEIVRYNGHDVQNFLVGTRVVVNFRVARHLPRISDSPCGVRAQRCRCFVRLLLLRSRRANKTCQVRRDGQGPQSEDRYARDQRTGVL